MISIIIPLYNVEEYIKNTINSILDNDFSDYEIILIDDGSTDDTSLLCEKYVKKDSRISLYKQDNYGVSYARNKGIELSKGEYIAFVDGDDKVDKNYLSKLFNRLISEDFDWVACSMKKDNNIIKAFNNDVSLYDEDIDVLKKKLFYSDTGYNLYSSVAGIYKKSILIDNNIRFKSDISYGEDVLFNYALVHHIKRFAYICEPIYFYTLNHQSATGHIRDDFLDVVFSLINELEKTRKEYKDDFEDEQLCYIFRQILTVLAKKTFRLTDKNKRILDYQSIEDNFSSNKQLKEIYNRLNPRIFNDYNRLILYLFKHKKYELLYKTWYLKNNVLGIKRAL